jgi:phage-related protein
MADYELGTAHGRIVVDYDDRGIAQAEKSLDRLQRRSRELLGQFATMAKGWISNARDMGRQSEQLTGQIEGIAKATAAVAVSTAVLNKSWGSVIPGVKVLKDLKEAFGGLPDGAERFPTLIQRIMRVAAAVSLFHGATGLLARATRNIAGVSALTRGLAGFGNIVNNLAAPLRVVSSAVTGFLSILKGIEVVKKYAKYFELFHVGTTGLAAGLNFVLPLIAKLAEDIKNLGGVIALAPAALGVFGLALGTIKVGLSGFGDALKAIGKGDAAAFNKALKDMAPAAQETAKALQTLYEKAWKPLQKAVQQKLFDGMAPVLNNLAGALLPSLERAMLRVATSFNGAAKEFAAFLSHPEVAQDFGEGMDYTAQAVQNLTRAAAPLAEAFYLIWRVGTEVMADITKGAGTAAEKFRDFIREARASGQLEAFMRRGVKAVKDLVTSVINFGKIFGTIFKGLGISGGDGFLAWLAQATEAFNNFLKSAQGQEILKAIGEWMADGARHAKELADVFFQYVLPAIQAFLPFIKQMGDAVNTGLVAAIKVLAPLFQVLGEVLSAMAPVLAPIVTAMVFMGTVMIGLGIAAKIAAGAIAIFRVGMLALKAVEFVGGLLTRLGGGFRLLGGALKLLKFGGIAAGLFLVADGINEMNLKAAGGDPSKLQGMEKTLYNIVEAGKKIASGDIPGILSEIGAQVDQTNQKWAAGEAPIQRWADKVATSFNKDLITPMENFGTTVNTFITNVGTTIGTGVSQWWSKVGESFDRDVIGFFATVPAKIGTAFSTIGTVIGTFASTLWNGFLTNLQITFGPVIAFFSQTPYQMGFAIGSGIGTIIAVAIDMMTQFGTAVNNGITNVITFFTNLPMRIAVTLATLGSTIFTTVVNAMTQFGTAVNQGIDNVIAWFTGLPGRVGGALAPLPGQVIQPAVTATTGFFTTVANKFNEAVAFVGTIPGRAGAAIASLVGIFMTKAQEAGRSFLTGITNLFNEVIAFVRGIPGRIQSAIGNLGNLLVNAGRSVIDGLLSGIKAGVQAMYDFVSGIAAGIAARKGPIPKDRILLIPAGVAIVQGLVRGMQQTMPALYRQVNGINSTLGGIGGVAGSVNLSASGATSNVRSLASAPTIPTGVTRGGDGASAGVVNNIGTVTIPAKDIKEFRDVTDFFSAVEQKARAGRSTR